MTRRILSTLLFFALTTFASTPATLKRISGNGQMNYAGFNTVAPLTVQAVDTAGNPLSNVSLTWVITKGQGTIVGPSTMTDAYGYGKALFRGDVTNQGESYEAQTITVSSSIGSVDFNETFCITQLPTGLQANLPTVQMLSGMTLEGNAGSVLTSAVMIQIGVTSGVQSGQPVPGIEFYMVDRDNPSGPVAAQCVSNGVTNDKGIGACDLLLGPSTGVFTICARVGESVVLSNIVLTIHPALPVPVILNAITNAASYMGNGVAPGEIVVLFGTHMGPSTLSTLTVSNSRVNTSLSNVQVTFDGVPAPLIYVSDKQISAVVPYSVAGKTSTVVKVLNNGTTSIGTTIAVASSSPGIFTANASGVGQAAALNQDGSLNTLTNPANPDSIVVLYATGEGQTAPTGTDGLLALETYPKPLQPVSVRISGLDAVVLYAGAAPTFLAGLMQVNVVLPVGLHSVQAPVVLTVGNVPSSAGVTVAIR
jgi:uncharacterized protein (TIGR03437 family)